MSTADATMLRTAEGAPTRRIAPGSVAVKWLTTTDHKAIGNLYFITSFVWFCLGGLMALVIRGCRHWRYGRTPAQRLPEPMAITHHFR